MPNEIETFSFDHRCGPGLRPDRDRALAEEPVGDAPGAKSDITIVKDATANSPAGAEGRPRPTRTTRQFLTLATEALLHKETRPLASASCLDGTGAPDPDAALRTGNPPAE